MTDGAPKRWPRSMQAGRVEDDKHHRTWTRPHVDPRRRAACSQPRADESPVAVNTAANHDNPGGTVRLCIAAAVRLYREGL